MIPYVDDSLEKVDSLEKAISIAEEKFTFSQAKIYQKDIEISDKGAFMIQKNQFKISKGGIKNLCSTLKIPDPFANRIPDDLFRTNINRLLQENSDKRINAYFNHEETLVDLNNNVSYQSIDTSRILSQLNGGDRLTRAMFQNHSAKIETVPGTPQLEIKTIGQPISIGNVLYLYPTAKSIPISYLLLWTLVCSNGMIAPRQFMREKLNIKSTSDSNILISKFLEKIKQIGLDENFLNERFEALCNRYFIFEEIKKIYSGIKRFVGKDEMENVLGTELVSTYLNSKDLKIGDDEVTDITGYNVFYSISYYASNITKSAKLSKQLQTKAGKLLLEDTI